MTVPASLSQKALIFDWGDTLMRVFPEYLGPMVKWPKVEVVPGAVECLSELYPSYICCVASNAGDSDAEQMAKALERVNLKAYFQFFFTSRELGFQKPDPRFFREIALRINIEPEACLSIGNDYQKDIIPAKSVGMGTVLLSYGSVTVPPESTDKIIFRLQDLVKIIHCSLTFRS